MVMLLTTLLYCRTIALHMLTEPFLHLPPWRGKVGMGGKSGMGTPPTLTPTLALPRRGGGKTLRDPGQRLPGGQNLLNSTPHFSGTKGFRQPAYASLLKEGHRLMGHSIACKENEALPQLRILLQRLVEA